jgi:hypothetical protein
VFNKIENVLGLYAKSEQVDKKDVEDWLLGWLNFFPEDKVDQAYLLITIGDLLHQYGL